MTSQPDGDESSSPPEEPQEVEPTHGKARAKEKTAEIKEHTIARAKQATAQVREKAEQATQLAKDKAPEPLLHTATHTAEHVHDAAVRARHLAADKTPEAVRERAAQAAHRARSKWTPLLAAGAAFLVFLFLRRCRQNR
ncbi:hypothetical protein [Streptomyces sp. NPDC006463]|uniref:hypothetical protein n=1 Tax=Streptomyces sp. NPDC006463 TaxID=3364746 RepID=UPI00368A73CF